MQVEQVDLVSVPTRELERAVAWVRHALACLSASSRPVRSRRVLILQRRYAPRD